MLRLHDARMYEVYVIDITWFTEGACIFRGVVTVTA